MDQHWLNYGNRPTLTAVAVLFQGWLIVAVALAVLLLDWKMVAVALAVFFQD